MAEWEVDVDADVGPKGFVRRASERVVEEEDDAEAESDLLVEGCCTAGGASDVVDDECECAGREGAAVFLKPRENTMVRDADYMVGWTRQL